MDQLGVVAGDGDAGEGGLKHLGAGRIELVQDEAGAGAAYPSGGSRLAGSWLWVEDVLTAARKDVRFDHGAGDDTGGTGASPSLER